jgi:preprotein translocase subunit SecG
MTYLISDFILVGSFLSALFGWLMGFLGIFLVLLILVQRGRGGGLTGALGGPGGQSAFGSKAGDMFTRVTFAVAGVWILVCALAMFALGDARTAGAKITPPSVRETGSDADPNPMQSGDSPLGIELPSDLGAVDGLNPATPPADPAAEKP